MSSTRQDRMEQAKELAEVSMADNQYSGIKPDPEVSGKPQRRRFTTRYKIRILERIDACSSIGEEGVLLRSEGLYHSNISTWRRQREEGVLQGLSPKKRGRKSKEINPLSKRVVQLEKENKRLFHKLKQAETIITVQKKISEILNIPLREDEKS